MIETKYDRPVILDEPECLTSQITNFLWTLEDCLRNSFGSGPQEVLIGYKGQLSLYRERVGQPPHSFYFEQSDRLSTELQRSMFERGYKLDLLFNHRSSPDDHFHLGIKIEEELFRVDPSIGRYLLGHHHTFVGTSKQLHQLLIQSYLTYTPFSFQGSVADSIRTEGTLGTLQDYWCTAHTR